MERELDKLVGLTQEKHRFIIQMARCLKDGTPFPHTLLYGFGGSGKTQLCRSMAQTLNAHFLEVEAAALRSRDSIYNLLIIANKEALNRNKKLCLFIDEIHRLTTLQQEAFYYPLKEWRLIRVVGDKREIVPILPFTLFAATTRLDLLDEYSLVARFPNKWKIERYSEEHLQIMIANIFRDKKFTFGPQVLKSVAKRCLGVPRQAYNLAEKVMDHAIYRGSIWITEDDATNAFKLEGLDVYGLNKDEVRYLVELYKSNGEAKGLHCLAGKLGVDVNTVESNIEPTLMYLGFMDRGRRGRTLTLEGKTHLKNSGLIRI